MCDPVSIGLSALSGYMQYQGQQSAAKTQAAAYNAQAAAADRNAAIESKKQEQISDKYAQESRQLNARMRLARGSQAAATGASGVDMNSQSSLDILSGTYDQYNQDKINLLTNQRNDNFSSRVQESNFINDANASRTAANNVRSQAKASGIATILGTAASMYGIAQPWKSASTNRKNASTTKYSFDDDPLGYFSPTKNKYNVWG